MILQSFYRFTRDFERHEQQTGRDSEIPRYVSGDETTDLSKVLLLV